jgi:hypothetical protein
MTRSEEIQNVIGVKLQIIKVIHDSAHERIMAQMRAIKELTEEWQEIRAGDRSDATIDLTKQS